MNLHEGKFTISYADRSTAPLTVEKDGLVLGRLQTCDVVLSHRSVSRVHAGINRIESEYLLINLSVSNALTLNGRLLAAEEADVLADGDIIQIGPFTITVARLEDELELTILHQFTGSLQNTSSKLPQLNQIMSGRRNQEVAGVLKVFWEKRTREKEDWGTRLRPREKPQPGKALINWKPTGDLRGTWRFGLFFWAFLIVGAIAVVAFYRYPQTFASQPLSDPHTRKINTSAVAVRSNENSCTTCHTGGREPLENACIKCHQAEQFHPSNTRAHEAAGITCTVCHKEHQGADFQLREAAIQGCAQCHNDANQQLYNGKAVSTAHNGTFGRPVENGKWIWNGLYTEIAAAIPAVNSTASTDETEQMRLSRQFHVIHLYRLKPFAGMRTDASNRVSCSSCHNSFDPVDRETPYQTCAGCHNLAADPKTNTNPPYSGQANCVSCHVQHPYSQNRWSEFLTDDALSLRQQVIKAQIERFREQ